MTNKQPSFFERPFTFDRVIRMIIIGLIMTTVFALIYYIRGALVPFLVAWVIAYLMEPMVSFFQHKAKLKSRTLAILASMAAIISSLTLIIIAVRPSVRSEIEQFKVFLSNYNTSQVSYSFIPKAWMDELTGNINWNHIVELLNLDSQKILSITQDLMPRLENILSGTMSALTGLAVVFAILLYLFFILLDYDSITEGVNRLIPNEIKPQVTAISSEVQYQMNRYFRGQALIASSVGVLLAIGFYLIGLPLGIILGLLIGVMNMIPYLQLAGILPMFLLAMLMSVNTGRSLWICFGLALAVLLIVQVIQDMILTPRIMGKAMGMNPALMLLSLSIWGSLLGFAGLIIALPMTVILTTYYQRLIIGQGDDATQETDGDTETDADAPTRS